MISTLIMGVGLCVALVVQTRRLSSPTPPPASVLTEHERRALDRVFNYVDRIERREKEWNDAISKGEIPVLPQPLAREKSK